MWVYLVGGCGSGEGGVWLHGIIQGLGLTEVLPLLTHELQGHLGLNTQLADRGGEKRWTVGGL